MLLLTTVAEQVERYGRGEVKARSIILHWQLWGAVESTVRTGERRRHLLYLAGKCWCVHHLVFIYQQCIINPIHSSSGFAFARPIYSPGSKISAFGSRPRFEVAFDSQAAS